MLFIGMENSRGPFFSKKANSPRKCPREFTYFFHVNSPFMSTRILTLDSNRDCIDVELTDEKKFSRFNLKNNRIFNHYRVIFDFNMR